MINDFIINAFFNCSLKAYFLGNNEVSESIEYNYEINRVETKIRSRLIQKWYNTGFQMTFERTKAFDNNIIVINSNVEINGIEIKIPFLTYEANCIVPVFIFYETTISKEIKSCFSYKSFLMANYLNLPIEKYKVVGANLKPQTFKITNIVPTSKIVEAVKNKQEVVKKSIVCSVNFKVFA